MIDTSEINRLKRDVSIASLLASRNILPVSQHHYELKYNSPLREDKSPSFYVNLNENVFFDVVVNTHRGDVIRLLQLLDGIGFALAVQRLQRFEPSPSTPSFLLCGSSTTTSSTKDKLRDVKLLANPLLLRYVESRGIHVATARKYLQEVHYTHADRYLYAVGFANDRGGYVLRNGVGCKRNIGPADLTTVTGWQNESADKTCNVFEGCFDFLSCLNYYGVDAPKATTYVLNSISHIARLVSKLSPNTKINVFFDNDQVGRQGLATLERTFSAVVDCSIIYDGYKDFNEFFTASRKNTHENSKNAND